MIQKAQVADAEKIAEVHVESWRTTYAGQFPDEYLAALSVPARTEIWRELLEKHQAHVSLFVENGVVAGFVSSGKSRDQDSTSQGAGEIYAIYLKAEHQGRGLGRQLWNAAISSLKEQGFSSAVVWVLDTNLPARDFYKKMGCQLDGATKAESIGGKPIREVRYVAPL
jgi:ribosomal protein S18 acetylase RimI-like enzyme